MPQRLMIEFANTNTGYSLNIRDDLMLIEMFFCDRLCFIIRNHIIIIFPSSSFVFNIFVQFLQVIQLLTNIKNKQNNAYTYIKPFISIFDHHIVQDISSKCVSGFFLTNVIQVILSYYGCVEKEYNGREQFIEDLRA